MDETDAGARPSRTGRSRGRRPANADTRSSILDAARSEFAEKGYDATSVRGIARRAGVDAALVHHYFNGKIAVFTSVMNVGVNIVEALPSVLNAPRDRVGETLIRAFLRVWDSPVHREHLVAAMRAGVGSTHARSLIVSFLQREIIGRVVGQLGVSDPTLRAGLAASQLMGLAMTRYVMPFPGMAEADVEQVVRAIAPTLQRYLTDESLAQPAPGN